MEGPGFRAGLGVISAQQGKFDAAIKLGRIQGGAYDEAVEGKQKLAQQK